jgi:hypothetical protein
MCAFMTSFAVGGGGGTIGAGWGDKDAMALSLMSGVASRIAAVADKPGDDGTSVKPAIERVLPPTAAGNPLLGWPLANEVGGVTVISVGTDTTVGAP